MSKTILDANAILRFILQDNLEQADSTEKILLLNEASIPLEVVAEVVFVLQKVYNVKRSLIAKKLKNLASIREDLIFEKNIVLYAADVYSSTSLDFVDCLLTGYFKIKNYSIFTFDKSLKKKIQAL
jgi:predicted nucleic-acid-binding protein